MRIAQLTLTTFRNHAQLALGLPNPPEQCQIHGQIVALVGANGSGKTAVLEAISLFAPGRGLRGADPADVPQLNQAGPRRGTWAAHLTLADARGLTTTLAQGVQPAATGRKTEKVLLINGQPAPATQLPQHLPLTWLTPATDFLFTGPPATRRTWLDDATAAWQPAHAVAVQRFRQHRQRRLKLLAQGRHLQPGGDEWLGVEEQLVAEWGLAVLHGRRDYLKACAVHATSGPLALHLTGSAQDILDEPHPVAALAAKLARSRSIDAQLGRTHAGPNTLDVTGTLTLPEGQTVALHQASSGQHKTALLAWLMAHVRLLAATHGAPPVVLIDEFTAHLDEARRQALLTQLAALNCQVWLADIALPRNLPASTHVVRLDEGPAPDTSEANAPAAP